MVHWYTLWSFGILYGPLVYVHTLWSIGICTYFMVHWYTLWSFGILYGPLVHFVAICYIFPRLGMLYQEKSGNPDLASNRWTDTLHN
jgi:hypothetical protein